MVRLFTRRVLTVPAFVLIAAVGASAQAPQIPPAKPSPAEQFNTTLRQAGGAAKARLMYDAMKKSDPAVVLFAEGEMNLYGYELLQGGNAKDAIVVFQMNVEEYPKSANVYDSLADGLLESGDKAGALKNSEKALALLDKDMSLTDEARAGIRESAEKKVKALKAPM